MHHVVAADWLAHWSTQSLWETLKLKVTHCQRFWSFTLTFLTWSDSKAVKSFSTFGLFHSNHLRLSLSLSLCLSSGKWSKMSQPWSKALFLPSVARCRQSCRHSGPHAGRIRAAECRISVGTKSRQLPPRTPALIGPFGILVPDGHLAGAFLTNQRRKSCSGTDCVFFGSFILQRNGWVVSHESLQKTEAVLWKALWEKLHSAEKADFGLGSSFEKKLFSLFWSANRTLKGPSSRLSPQCENSTGVSEFSLRGRNQEDGEKEAEPFIFAPSAQLADSLSFWCSHPPRIKRLILGAAVWLVPWTCCLRCTRY